MLPVYLVKQLKRSYSLYLGYWVFLYIYMLVKVAVDKLHQWMNQPNKQVLPYLHCVKLSLWCCCNQFSFLSALRCNRVSFLSVPCKQVPR
jgi:hypothetical protein